MTPFSFFLTILLVILSLSLPAPAPAREVAVVDALGRRVALPGDVSRVICSGPGCLRLLTYLQAGDMVVGVDDMEKRQTFLDSRPYALAHPGYRDLPLFGAIRGHDNAEQILSLDPQPQVIFKTYAGVMGHDPVSLQNKTAIPVVAVEYGDLIGGRPALYASLRLMGSILNRSERAEAVIAFFEATIDDLKRRVHAEPEQGGPGVFVGGVAFKGAHGLLSTEPFYPPFLFVKAVNLAAGRGTVDTGPRQARVSKEKIVHWDPEYIFLDLATLTLGNMAGGLHELQHDPAYRNLAAVRQERVYGVLPYNSYSSNYGSILANAYFVGKLLHPHCFADIEPAAKADALYEFLVGRPVFAQLNDAFNNLVFRVIDLDKNAF